MTAKEKAEELVGKFEPYVIRYGQDDVVGWLSEETPIFEYQKQCALIAVDELIESEPLYPNEADWDDCGATHKYYYEEQRNQAKKFWQEVKQEIEKLLIQKKEQQTI